MIRVTIAECHHLAPVLTQADAPLWQNPEGDTFRVASGEMSRDVSAWSVASDTPAPLARPGQTVCIAGLDGVIALALMGLRPWQADTGFATGPALQK